VLGRSPGAGRCRVHAEVLLVEAEQRGHARRVAGSLGATPGTEARADASRLQAVRGADAAQAGAPHTAETGF